MLNIFRLRYNIYLFWIVKHICNFNIYIGMALKRRRGGGEVFPPYLILICRLNISVLSGDRVVN